MTLEAPMDPLRRSVTAPQRFFDLMDALSGLKKEAVDSCVRMGIPPCPIWSWGMRQSRARWGDLRRKESPRPGAEPQEGEEPRKFDMIDELAPEWGGFRWVRQTRLDPPVCLCGAQHHEDP